MIIRPDGDSLLFITQPDHAQLSAEAIAHWRTDGFDDHPRRETILLAAREHDNGWVEEDAGTHVDAAGHPLDFVSVPAEVRQRIWPRAVDRIADQDPYAAALIAEHALTVYGHLETDPESRGFVEALTARRAVLLERCDDSAAATLAADYRFVNAADRISLAFCTGWTQPLESHGRRIILSGQAVVVAPDPFAGARVPLRIAARRLTRRVYASNAELRKALETAPVQMLEGYAVGTITQR